MWSRRGLVVTLSLLGALAAGCGSSSAPSGGSGVVFVVDVSGERFRILLRDEARIARARRILASEEEQKVVTGDLAPGNGGFNTGYSWHLVPETVSFADITIELCDGRPSSVQSELSYWLNTVKRYCPWQGRIVAEETAT